jgi:hypothetical protein
LPARALSAAVLAAALVVGAPAARAAQFECPEDTGRPQEMNRKAQALFEQALRREPADPGSALELLLCAQRFADKPAVALRIGIVAERLGRTELAVRSFERYLALAGSAAPDRVEMQQHITRLREKLASTSPAPEPEPQPEPELEPRPAPDTGPKPPIAGWALAASGGVLMVVGGVLLWSAKQRSDDVHEIEPGTTLWNSEQARAEYEQAKREQTLGILGLALGAAAATVGMVLVISSERELSASASASSHGVRGSVRLRF